LDGKVNCSRSKLAGKRDGLDLTEGVMDEQNEKQEKTTGLNIRLAPVGNSDQPMLANFTRLNGAPGMVFVDFGFLEPAVIAGLSAQRTEKAAPATMDTKH